MGAAAKQTTEYACAICRNPWPQGLATEHSTTGAVARVSTNRDRKVWSIVAARSDQCTWPQTQALQSGHGTWRGDLPVHRGRSQLGVYDS